MLLGSTKAQVDALLGRSVMSRSLLGMLAQGEKSYSYPQSTNDIIVGFFNDVARYMAVIKRHGPLTSFSPAELASILSLNAPPGLWKKEIQDAVPPSTTAKASKTSRRNAISHEASVYFSYSEKNVNFSRELLGWQPRNKPFIFFFLPAWPDQVPILFNEWQLLKAIS